MFKGNPWIAADRRYLEPDEGGLGLIKIKDYAVKDYGDALRLAWAKQETYGKWSTIRRGQYNKWYEYIKNLAQYTTCTGHYFTSLMPSKTFAKNSFKQRTYKNYINLLNT